MIAAGGVFRQLELFSALREVSDVISTPASPDRAVPVSVGLGARVDTRVGKLYLDRVLSVSALDGDGVVPGFFELTQFLSKDL